MRSAILIRHGETEWSRSGRHTGHTDIPLTPDGEQQARALAPCLDQRGIVRVFVSPLIRARRTAELAGLLSDPSKVTVDPDLIEWDYGAYEGITKVEILASRPTWNLWRDGVMPGNADRPGESVAEVVARLDRVVARVRAILEEDRGDVALVAHGHALRMLTTRWLGQEPAFGASLILDPATISVLRWTDDGGVLAQWNSSLAPYP